MEKIEFLEKQPAKWLWGCLVVVVVGILLDFFFGSNQFNASLFYAVIPFLAIITLLLFEMKTKVDANTIVVSYGIGMIKKTIKRGEIESLREVNPKWYWGAGIRFVPKGIMFSVNFTKAMEVKMKNKSRVFLIGSEKVEELIKFCEIKK